MQVGLASTTRTEGNKVNTDKKEQQQQTGQQHDFQDKLDEEPIIEEKMEIDQDSLEDDSVNKYNFIFYFLYKFKLLNLYLVSPIVNVEPSPGTIQAALHLDMPVYSFDRIRMYVEAINGQLPDIDLVSKS